MCIYTPTVIHIIINYILYSYFYLLSPQGALMDRQAPGAVRHHRGQRREAGVQRRRGRRVAVAQHGQAADGLRGAQEEHGGHQHLKLEASLEL